MDEHQTALKALRHTHGEVALIQLATSSAIETKTRIVKGRRQAASLVKDSVTHQIDRRAFRTSDTVCLTPCDGLLTVY
jgi:hypothetical protein